MSKNLQPPSTPSSHCAQAQEAILALLDEEATPEQKALLSEHLDQCPACRSYQSSMQHLTSSIRGMDEVPVPAGLELKIMSRLAVETSTKEPHSSTEFTPAAEEASVALDDNLVDFPKLAPSRQNHRLKLVPVAAAILTVALSLPLIFQAINPNLSERQPAATQTGRNLGAMQFSHSDSHEAASMPETSSKNVALGVGGGTTKAVTDSGAETAATAGSEGENSGTPTSSKATASQAGGSEEIASINVANAYASNKEGDIYFDPLSNVVDF